MFNCDSPGVALYGVRVLALSLVEGSPEGTQLELTVDSDVTCVAGTPTPTPDGPPITLVDPTSILPPEATAPPPSPSSSTASLEVGCVHTNPGVSSDLLVRITGLEPGQEVFGVVSGSGLDFDQHVTAFADSEGAFFWRLEIFAFGSYAVDFNAFGLITEFVVDEVCTGLDGFDD